MSSADAAAVVVPITGGETILRGEEREIGILLAREEVTVTYARCAAGERVARPHVHHEHTDAFYVFDGELTFEIGREAEVITLSAGGFAAVPPRVAHSFRTDGERPARWLTIHARDGGFAAFMRGTRDGVDVEWDISAVQAGGGLPARAAIVSSEGGDPRLESGARLRCSLPDLRVLEWDLRGPHPKLPSPSGEDCVDSFVVIEGELEATLAGTRQAVGPGTLISAPCGLPYTFDRRGHEPARMLSIHTPGFGRDGQPVNA